MPRATPKVVNAVRLRFPIPALVAASFLAVCAPCPAAYVTGVYWVEQDVYYLNLTLHNNEPDDEWWVFDLSAIPGGFDAQAPPFWSVRECDTWFVAWCADGGHWLPPGEELSGFTFQTYELDDWYSYKVEARDNDWTGYFQPELVPWPPGVGHVAVGILGLWAARRLRGS
jgi:hypothetical protein